MLRALLSLGSENQFEKARWIPEPLARNKYKLIRVEVVDEKRRQFSTIIQNLITSADSTVLQTSYSYDYKVDQEIFYRGEFWIITSVTDITKDIAPQSLGLVKANITKQSIIEVIKVR